MPAVYSCSVKYLCMYTVCIFLNKIFLKLNSILLRNTSNHLEKKTTNDLNSHPTFVTMEFREVSIWDSNLYIGIFPVFYVYFRMLHAFSQVPDVTFFIIKIYLLYLIIHIRLFQLLNHWPQKMYHSNYISKQQVCSFKEFYFYFCVSINLFFILPFKMIFAAIHHILHKRCQLPVTTIFDTTKIQKYTCDNQ